MPGRLLLTVVFVYGACIVVFGFSRSYPLSLAALGVSGFVDLYSMNIRSTTVALASPDRLRGRVNAVEMVFISASNQLGYFESGLAAALVGTIPAVVGGGAMTMLIAISWRHLFPALADVDRLEALKPQAVEAPAAVERSSVGVCGGYRRTSTAAIEEGRMAAACRRRRRSPQAVRGDIGDCDGQHVVAQRFLHQGRTDARSSLRPCSKARR